MGWRLRFAWILRVILPALLVPLAGVAPQPHALAQALNQARRALEAGSPRQAARCVAQAAERMPQRAGLWEQAGHYALQGGEPQRALEYFGRARQAAGLSVEGQIALGEAALRSGDPAGAMRAWQAALQAGGSATYLRGRLMDLHLELGDLPSAIDHARELARLQPSDAALHYRLGLLLATQEPEAALAYLARAEALHPALASAAESLAASIRSARLSPSPAYGLVMAGRALAALGEWALAAEAFRQATLERPDYAEAWAFLGEARQRLGQDGLPELEKALALDSQSISANTFLGLYWNRRGRPALALVFLQAVIDQDPGNPALQAEAGNLLAAMGQLPAALAHYRRAAELASRDPAYWRSLAAFSIRYEYQVRQVALPAARQAVLIDPQDPAALDLMGQAFTLLKDFHSAERFFRRALQADAGYAPARLHFGALYLLRGEAQPAITQLELARNLAPAGSDIRQQAENLLQETYP